MRTWNQFPATIQSAIIRAIKADIRKRLVSSTKDSISDSEPNQPIPIRNLGNYANELKRQVEASKDFMKLKRRRQAEHSSRHTDKEAIVTPIRRISQQNIVLTPQMHTDGDGSMDGHGEDGVREDEEDTEVDKDKGHIEQEGDNEDMGDIEDEEDNDDEEDY